MNFKKLILLMLIGIICSVSVVSAADINDSGVESGLDDNQVVSDDLQNGFENQEPVKLSSNNNCAKYKDLILQEFQEPIDIHDFINNSHIGVIQSGSVVSSDDNQVVSDDLQNGFENQEPVKLSSNNNCAKYKDLILQEFQEPIDIHDFINNSHIGVIQSVSVVSDDDRFLTPLSIYDFLKTNKTEHIIHLENAVNIISVPTLQKMSFSLIPSSSNGGGPGNAIGGAIKGGGKYSPGGYNPGESGSSSKSKPVG